MNDADQWFDEDEVESRNIFDIIKEQLKETKRFHTACAFKAFKALTAVLQYVKLWERYKPNTRCTQPCMNASLAIARHCGKIDGVYFAWQIRSNERYLLKHGQLPPLKKDSLHGQLTLLDNKSVLLDVRRYLAAQSLGSITTKDFCREVNEVIAPAVGFFGKEATISKCTARNWLRKLGYSCVEVQKGLYHDGHGRPNVVAARTKFLEQMAGYEK